MTAPDQAPEPKKTLAPAGPSTHDGWHPARTPVAGHRDRPVLDPRTTLVLPLSCGDSPIAGQAGKLGTQ
jgi:hypothetical protein